MRMVSNGSAVSAGPSPESSPRPDRSRRRARTAGSGDGVAARWGLTVRADWPCSSPAFWMAAVGAPEEAGSAISQAALEAASMTKAAAVARMPTRRRRRPRGRSARPGHRPAVGGGEHPALRQDRQSRLRPDGRQSSGRSALAHPGSGHGRPSRSRNSAADGRAALSVFSASISASIRYQFTPGSGVIGAAAPRPWTAGRRRLPAVEEDAPPAGRTGWRRGRRRRRTRWPATP